MWYVIVYCSRIFHRTPTMAFLDYVHTGPDLYGHYINLKSFKTSMTFKFVIKLQNLIKTYHRKSGKSKYDLKLTELDVETTQIRSRVNEFKFQTFLRGRDAPNPPHA